MADPPPDADTSRWVKVFGIIAIVVVLLFVILLFTRGPHRGPGDHTPSSGSGSQILPSSLIEEHTPPEGGHG